MQGDQLTLWRRLESLNFDGPRTIQPFSLRLARENGWTRRHAIRVIEEYRRFLFLTVTAGPACPSEKVDEAWHLHLCYTRSYWNDLCRDVLGRPLHHIPTEGGAQELERHRAMYSATLDAYRRAFEEEPPADIWPEVDERFGGRGKVAVDLTNHMVLPRPRLAPLMQLVRRRLQSFAWIGAMAMLPALGATWNPLDFTGTQFLWFYGALLASAIFGGWALREILRNPDDGSPFPELDAYEIAVLSEGERLAMQTALCEMIVSGQLAVNKADGRLSVVENQRPHGAPRLIQAIYDDLANRPEAMVADAYSAGQEEAARIGAKLESLGLLETPESSRAARWIPSLLVTAVFLLGVAKIIVGAGRNKPVGFLIFLCIAAILAVALFYKPIHRTSRGEHLLNRLKGKRRDLKAKRALFDRPPADVALGIALFGISAMAVSGSGVADLHGWITPKSAGGSGCSSGCGGSGCGGGGCGGCGGD
jgi:uncharacterized protein (TIGR04222 family)